MDELTTTTTTNGADEQTSEPKTYSQEEVDKLLQSESDRRVSEALKKQAKKNEAAVREAQKVAQMNEAEKYEYELKQREAAIEAKEKELALAENKNICGKILAEKNISLDLVDFVVAEDADTMNSNIKKLSDAINRTVKAEVERRLGSNSPKKDLPLDSTLTRETFNKLSLSDQQDLLSSNPELVKSIMK